MLSLCMSRMATHGAPACAPPAGASSARSCSCSTHPSGPFLMLRTVTRSRSSPACRRRVASLGGSAPSATPSLVYTRRLTAVGGAGAGPGGAVGCSGGWVGGANAGISSAHALAAAVLLASAACCGASIPCIASLELSGTAAAASADPLVVAASSGGAMGAGGCLGASWRSTSAVPGRRHANTELSAAAKSARLKSSLKRAAMAARQHCGGKTQVVLEC
jgi:hypothetical protein